MISDDLRSVHGVASLLSKAAHRNGSTVNDNVAARPFHGCSYFHWTGTPTLSALSVVARHCCSAEARCRAVINNSNIVIVRYLSEFWSLCLHHATAAPPQQPPLPPCCPCYSSLTWPSLRFSSTEQQPASCLLAFINALMSVPNGCWGPANTPLAIFLLLASGPTRTPS